MNTVVTIVNLYCSKAEGGGEGSPPTPLKSTKAYFGHKFIWTNCPHTGKVTSVTSPSNSSQVPDTSQILLFLPHGFRVVTSLRVWGKKKKRKEKKTVVRCMY